MNRSEVVKSTEPLGEQLRDFGEIEQSLALAAQEMDMARPYMFELLKALYPDAKKRIWSTIISDDKSGRLPAMTVKEAIRSWGFGDLDLIGIDVAANEDYLRNVMPTVRQRLGTGRALVVTESVISGLTIEKIERHIPEIDVASLTISSDFAAECIMNSTGYNWYTSTFAYPGLSRLPFHTKVSLIGHDFLEKYLGIVEYPGGCKYIPVEPWRSQLISSLVQTYGQGLARDVLLECEQNQMRGSA